jgi:glycosyltransferase involved in cell wall biosynthesis
LGLEWEAVFVDDGSSDASMDVIRTLAGQHHELRYLSFAANQGQSAAFCAGFDAARHDTVVTMDADLQNDPGDIPAMLEKYVQGYDMVIGWRAQRKDTRAKRWASRLANAIRRSITRDTVHDTATCRRCCRPRARVSPRSRSTIGLATRGIPNTEPGTVLWPVSTISSACAGC